MTQKWECTERLRDTARQCPQAVELQVPLQPHEVRLLGPKAEGPLSDYRNVQLHAVE